MVFKIVEKKAGKCLFLLHFQIKTLQFTKRSTKMRFTVWFILKGNHLKRKLSCTTKMKFCCDKKKKYFG